MGKKKKSMYMEKNSYEKACLCDMEHERLGGSGAFDCVLSLSRWQSNFIACSFHYVQWRVLILHWWP